MPKFISFLAETLGLKSKKKKSKTAANQGQAMMRPPGQQQYPPAAQPMGRPRSSQMYRSNPYQQQQGVFRQPQQQGAFRQPLQHGAFRQPQQHGYATTGRMPNRPVQMKEDDDGLTAKKAAKTATLGIVGGATKIVGAELWTKHGASLTNFVRSVVE